MSKLSYKLKLIVASLFLKVISTLYSCIKRIKTVGNLIQGSLKGSKWIKTGDISMKSTEISEFHQLCTVIIAKLKQITDERVMLAFLLAISIKDILSEAQMGV